MNFFIRVDANKNIGIGHVSRCISLGLELRRRNHKVIFVSRSDKIIKEILKKYNLQFILLDGTSSITEEKNIIFNIIKKYKINVGIVDSYELNSSKEYLSFLKGIKNFYLVTIEGYKKYPVQGDVIINPNIFAKDRKYLYNKNESKLLFGPEYTLIKPEYLEVNHKKNDYGNILVTFGGSDPQQMTLPIMQDIKDITRSISIVIGPFYDNKKEIRVISNAYPNISVYEDLYDLKSLFLNTHLAVCGAGFTVSELIYFNIPSIVYWTVENQKLIAEKYGKLRLGINMGNSKDYDGQKLFQYIKTMFDNQAIYNEFIANNKKIIPDNPIKLVVNELVCFPNI
ncbi:MAG: UDP-2,4-diacetamido-2,4,6-trideoxy-beta-L-altropyranose hydrolase [Halanaerobiales bacterium]